jgi:hypothetical protein
MKDLIQEIKDHWPRPRLLVQYVVLNFFLLSVGGAAVVYIKNEALTTYQQKQNELIIEVSKDLDKVTLPARVEEKVDALELNAEVKVGQSPATAPPKK